MRIAISTILITTSLSPSSARNSGRARSGWIIVSAAPNTRPKKITPSRSLSTADLIGLRVTMPTSVSMPNVLCADASTLADASVAYVAISPVRVSGVMRVPGCTKWTRSRPLAAARKVVAKKYPIAFPPTRPATLRSPSPATPSAMDAKTSGMTIM
jgi:hypothetical protein